MRNAYRSAMYKFPTRSKASAPAPMNEAAVAGPPSPEWANAPLPANVLMIPEILSTRLTRLFAPSEMYKSPRASTAKPSICLKPPPRSPPNCAAVAGPPSPEKPSVPLPATVSMIPVATVTLRTFGAVLVSPKYTLPSRSVASDHGLRICAAMAGPPSPVDPATPVPATVVMIPVAKFTLRSRVGSSTYRFPL